METYYHAKDLAKFSEIGKDAPELAKKFFEYYSDGIEEISFVDYQISFSRFKEIFKLNDEIKKITNLIKDIKSFPVKILFSIKSSLFSFNSFIYSVLGPSNLKPIIL